MGYGLISKLLAGAFLWTALVQANPLPENVQSKIVSYLLPENHPIKPELDALFSSTRVILNLKTLEAAGFKKSKPRKFTRLIVTSHPQFPGYIFKLYLDAQRYYKNTYEYIHWMMRVQGVEKVRHEINARGLQELFKAPKKWIYILPSTTSSRCKDYACKHCILVEEDMELFSDAENKALWTSDFVSPQLLEGLFHILKTVGLDDCLKPDNLPFSKDGRVAFIDTQTFDRHVEYKRLLPFLSPVNQSYWKLLIK